MLSKKKRFSNFSNAVDTTSSCFRPDNERQIEALCSNTDHVDLLARGNGSSYSHCCVNDRGLIIDVRRLNHLIDFDEATGLLICQGGVTFADLFLVHPEYIPPVIPGTLAATVAGGVANDVHGKNNPHAASFGQHIQWLELQLGNQSLHCSPAENADLFYATIGGLGLTGIIKRVAITMRKAPHFVRVETEKYSDFESLLERMRQGGCNYDYQVAWLDLLNKPSALLSLANYTEMKTPFSQSKLTVPKLPLRLIDPWLMKQFNRYHFKKNHAQNEVLALQQFNNPLDSISHWNRLYGKKGFLQFQALFDEETAVSTLEQLLRLIQGSQATATLAVLKYFTKKGPGLLSFVRPGFTLAIDFINNQSAKDLVSKMNEWISNQGGRIYLAKDLLLTATQFKQQYPQNEQFSKLLKDYKSEMRSDLSQRLGLTG